MTRRATQIIGWTLTAAATYAAVFVLPYRFPLSEPLLSDTWIAGANNQVAAIALAVVSVAVTLLCSYRSAKSPEPNAPGTLDRRYLYAGILVAILWTTGLGWAVARGNMYWGDEGYFLTQLRTGLVFHKAIYTEFEFAYGPLLYLWPAAFIRLLAPLGVSFAAAYLVSLAMLQSLGLALAFYTVHALPLRRFYQACAFVLITLGTLNSLLGLNYSVFRFILPFAAVVFLTRQRTLAKSALVAICGEIACLATSPELGLAFGGAAIAYAIYRSIADNSQWLLAALAPLMGAAVFYAMVGPTYLFTLSNIAKGGFNTLLRPAPHIVGLLVATVVLAPLAVARYVRRCGDGSMILGFYVTALGMLPAALGRSDAIHTFFDGMGLYLLSLVTLNAAPALWRRIGIVFVATVIAFTVGTNSRLYDPRLSMILRPHAVQEDWGFDEAALRRAIGDAKVSTPILAPQRVIEDLTSSGQYVPDYFCGWVGVWDRAAEQRKIADMRRTEFALVAFLDPPDFSPERYDKIRATMRFGLERRVLRPEYLRGELLTSEIQAHWIPVQRLGDYELYRQRH